MNVYFPAARQTFGLRFMKQKGSSVTDECPGRAPFDFIVCSYQVKNKNFAKQPLAQIVSGQLQTLQLFTTSKNLQSSQSPLLPS